jgi:hypothetical protein
MKSTMYLLGLLGFVIFLFAVDVCAKEPGVVSDLIENRKSGKQKEPATKKKTEKEIKEDKELDFPKKNARDSKGSL